ncbi:MAG: NAD-dependent epimerase/dehydratase family protein [Microbacteriaceae bacterium]
MKVLVIGGSGFIGTRLIDALLERGHDVTNLDRAERAHPGVTFIEGDVRSAPGLTVASVGHDAIVNLAAEHRDDVHPLSRYTEVNVDGASAVVEAAEANGIDRIVFTSSVAVYGLDKVNPDETWKPEPFNEYGRTKLAAEEIFSAWAEADAGRSLAIIRPSVVFGEGNRGNVHTLAAQVASGRFLQVGKGDNRKSMSYVGNIVEFLADRLSAAPGIHLTNFADKPDLSTRELVALLRETLGRTSGSRIVLPLPVGIFAGHVFDLAGKITRRTFPISAIRMRKFAAETTVSTERLAATGFTPRYSLKESLVRTLAVEFPHLASATHPVVSRVDLGGAPVPPEVAGAEVAAPEVPAPAAADAAPAMADVAAAAPAEVVAPAPAAADDIADGPHVKRD